MMWDPKLYLKFGAERTRPAIDLVARIEAEAPARIIDLGCGPGNSTAILRARWPQARIIGLDNDPAMLSTARGADPSVDWQLGDAGHWTAEPVFDVVFSNAALHWLPDHDAVLARWFGALAPGGALAVQLPSHRHSLLHQSIYELAEEPAWRNRMQSAREALTSHSADYYYDVLCRLTPKIDLWETAYGHMMESPEAILAWVRSTGLRPFLQALPDEGERNRFETALLERVAAAYPRRRDGRILFPFHRLFFIAGRT